jgi:hypothetical protein
MSFQLSLRCLLHFSDAAHEDSCLVLFVDYGIIEMVSCSTIYSLQTEFFELPCQALNVNILDISAFNSPYKFVGSVVCLSIRCNDGCNFVIGTISPDNLQCERRMIEIESRMKLKFQQVRFPFQAVVAHICSVTDFYLHKLDTVTAESMKLFESYMQSFYSNRKNHCVKEGNAGSIACVYSSVTELYCRAIILEAGVDDCFVQLVDYGHFEKISLKGIHHLPVEFLFFPVFSIRCQLNGFGQENTMEEATKVFRRMVAFNDVWTVVEGISTPECSTWNYLYPVDLCDFSDTGLLSISQHLLKMGNKFGVVCDWDPMQTDYLSSQNKYHKLKKRARPSFRVRVDSQG